jgi:hypothetical protein
MPSGDYPDSPPGESSKVASASLPAQRTGNLDGSKAI